MPLPPPPVTLLANASLFLDLDGTLVEFADRPDGIEVGQNLRKLLIALSERLNGRIAVISGRALADLDRHLDIPGIALSGSHGLETRDASGKETGCEASPDLDGVKARFAEFARRHDLISEDKPGSTTLHFRRHPDLEDQAATLAEEAAQAHDLVVQRGNLVVEVRLPGADKGSTVRYFMAEPPFVSGSPVVVGDDLTDEHAFEAAAALGGAGILVGPDRPTAATYRLPDVDAVRAWLATA